MNVVVSIFLVSVTHLLHFKEYIFNIGKIKKKINIKKRVKNVAWNENISKRCNHPLLPKGIRELIIGKSGCGKTTLLIKLLLRPGWIDYNNINICW